MNTLLQLFKIRIAVLASLSSAAGWVLASGTPGPGLITAASGVFLLACGAGALNQFQEKETDALMERTRQRPIPSGKVSSAGALCTACLMSLSGIGFLVRTSSLLALALGLFAVFWYNGVYTYLKTWSRWAAVPGALTGALPPMIGWVSGGGDPFDSQIFAVVLFFFLWQIPHFWLLLLRYPGDYEKAGLPCLLELFSEAQLMRITFIWVFAVGVATLLLPVFLSTRFPLTRLALSGVTLWLVVHAACMLRQSLAGCKARIPLREINLFALWVIALLTLDRIMEALPFPGGLTV